MLGSGDCTVIKTPAGKTIIIDTGEQENTLVEYLLDRKIKKIDYLMISHFDSDHSGKSREVIEKLNVKNLIISKQAEKSNEFQETINLAMKNKVNIITVKAGDTVKIEKEIYFKILWPEDSKIIKENALNNNSIVAKLCYGNFSILFTGDIEEIAEDKILQKYDKSILQSTILKVAHHGSKSSSTEEFIKAVKSKISLIGVGKDNKFGHPNEKVIERLEFYQNEIYRTDLCGEISLKIYRRGRIKIKMQD